MKTGDKALYLVLLWFFLISVALSGAFFVRRSGEGNAMRDYLLYAAYDGQAFEATDMRSVSEETTIELRGGGGTNTLLVSPSGVRMVSADCPGGDCLRMPQLVSGGGVIVCLPHRLIVKLQRRGDPSGGNTIDAFAY